MFTLISFRGELERREGRKRDDISRIQRSMDRVKKIDQLIQTINVPS